jgi:hypothetical protein
MVDALRAVLLQAPCPPVSRRNYKSWAEASYAPEIEISFKTVT